MTDPEKRLRLYALEAMKIRNKFLSACKQGEEDLHIMLGAVHAFDLLREITESELTEKERSFGASHREEIRKLQEECDL